MGCIKLTYLELRQQLAGRCLYIDARRTLTWSKWFPCDPSVVQSGPTPNLATITLQNASYAVCSSTCRASARCEMRAETGTLSPGLSMMNLDLLIPLWPSLLDEAGLRAQHWGACFDLIFWSLRFLEALCFFFSSTKESSCANHLWFSANGSSQPPTQQLHVQQPGWSIEKDP